jgi:hypothetical protein
VLQPFGRYSICMRGNMATFGYIHGYGYTHISKVVLRHMFAALR